MGRGVDQEAIQGGALRKKPSLRDVLPEEEAEYYDSLREKHFSKNSSGSRFDKSITLEGLIESNSEKLLSKEDDRQELIRLGVDPEALLSDRSYFLLEAPGSSGLIPSDELDKEKIVTLSREKTGSLSFLVASDVLGQKTNWATAIVGDYPRDPSRRALITVFPGLPTNPARSSLPEENEFGFVDGQEMTVAQLEKLLGREDLLLQVKEGK